MPFSPAPWLSNLSWRFLGAALCSLSLTGCITNPTAVTSENAPPDAAHAGKGYVAFEAYLTSNGYFGSSRNPNNVMFVNTEAAFNPFYLRTPNDMKVQSMPLRPGAVYALNPGTYRLVFLSMPHTLTEFSMSNSPVEFSVAAGEVVYVGALQDEVEKVGGFFDPNHFRMSFSVSDEFAENEAAIDKNLALLKGAPPIHTRLMTVRRADVEVSPPSHFSLTPTLKETTPPAAEQPPPPPPPPSLPEAPPPSPPDEDPP